MVRSSGSTGRYAPESGPIMLTLSFVVHDPLRTLDCLDRRWKWPTFDAGGSASEEAGIHRTCRWSCGMAQDCARATVGEDATGRRLVCVARERSASTSTHCSS